MASWSGCSGSETVAIRHDLTPLTDVDALDDPSRVTFAARLGTLDKARQVGTSLNTKIIPHHGPRRPLPQVLGPGHGRTTLLGIAGSGIGRSGGQGALVIRQDLAKMILTLDQSLLSTSSARFVTLSNKTMSFKVKVDVARHSPGPRSQTSKQDRAQSGKRSVLVASYWPHTCFHLFQTHLDKPQSFAFALHHRSESTDENK